MNKVIAVFLLVVISGFIAEAQSPNIKFVQGDTLSLKQGKENYYEITLRKEPFTLIFPGNELLVCAGLDKDLFRFTKPGTDINADFNSYFFIYKFIAASEDSDFLTLEKDAGNALNETHGAQAAGSDRFGYTVRSLAYKGTLKSISEFEELFMALWLDINKDQFIDKEELLWVKAQIRD